MKAGGPHAHKLERVTIARAVLTLYSQHRGGQQSLQTLASRKVEHDDLVGVSGSALPSQEVAALIQQSRNYFPELEAHAERMWRTAPLNPNDIFNGLVRMLEEDLGVTTKVVNSRLGGAVRRYEPKARELRLSEVMAPRTRHFQIAHQIGLLTQSPVLDRRTAHPSLTTEDSRKLARMVLANYFAGAILMPYSIFHQAAEAERYDVELLSHRFRTSFEQVCHRLTTLQRPGHEVVRFHLIKIDPDGEPFFCIAQSVGMVASEPPRLCRPSDSAPTSSTPTAWCTPTAST